MTSTQQHVDDMAEDLPAGGQKRAQEEAAYAQKMPKSSAQAAAAAAQAAAQAAAVTSSSSQPDHLPEIAPDEIQMERLIGEGSFGKVMQGRCRQKPVAVKILHKQQFDAKTLDAFRKEVAMCSLVFHPNICLFMGACTQPGHCMIVTELVAKGDLESMLHDTSVHLSLTLRMKMARDAALGMNWLHGSTPKFIHRDLKTSNLLVDENMRIKVCDFGLSQMLPDGEVARDQKSAKGTPLWMAPEVMMFRGFTEKCDIYSFGIVLWEILTRQEPFKEFHSFKEFRDAICKRHVRPPIPDDTLPSIRALIESAWHADPNVRPDFGDIVAQLDDIIVESAIADDLGRAFWKHHYLKRDPVLWSELLPTFLRYLGVPDDATNTIVQASAAAVAAQQAPNSAAAAAALATAQSQVTGSLPDFAAVQRSIACLRLLVCDMPTQGGGGVGAADGAVVPIEKFGKVLDCFPETDHEILTSRGFMTLAQIEASDEWRQRTLRVASYDAAAQQLVYEQPRRLVVNSVAATPLVEFADKRNNIALATTPGHQMYVSTTDAAAGTFTKIKAATLLRQHAAGRFEFKTVAAAGVKGVDGNGVVARHVLEAFGAKLADKLNCAAAELEWLWQLDGASARIILDCFYTSSSSLLSLSAASAASIINNDAFVRLHLHAGYDLPNESCRGGSSSSSSSSVQMYERKTGERTWCFEMPRGFVVVRRRTASGAATRPTIQGNCFAPVSGVTVLDEIQSLCAETWFHGHVSTPEAQTRLANTPAGCFLVRFSSQEHGSYTISLVTPAGAIRHQRVRHVDGYFVLQSQRYASLRAVVEQGGHLLNLLIPCPGSMFGSIFAANPHPILGYEEISWSPSNEVVHD